MNLENIDFSKIRIVSTKKERQAEFQFPEEGWFIGALHHTYRRDCFTKYYLRKAKWTTYGENSWGGYSERNKDGTLCCWVDFGLNVSKIETSFLYYCKDKETAEKLESILNNIPSGSILRLAEAITNINYKIEQLKEQRKELMNLKKYVKYLSC